VYIEIAATNGGEYIHIRCGDQLCFVDVDSQHVALWCVDHETLNVARMKPLKFALIMVINNGGNSAHNHTTKNLR